MFRVLLLIRDEACCDKRVIEPIDRLRRVIKFENFAYVDQFDLSAFIIYYSHIEMAIILVCNSESLAVVTLLN